MATGRYSPGPRLVLMLLPQNLPSFHEPILTLNQTKSMNSNPTVWLYLSYLLISIVLTVWVARTLHKNGRIFLVDCFNGREEMADSVNHLLVVGFYLINIGYVVLALKTDTPPADLQQVIENLSSKVGVVLLVLGGMHFLNLFIFSRLHQRNDGAQLPPPIQPTEYTFPPVPNA